MLINYYFSDWLADMQNFWEFSISTLPWRLLTFAVLFFAFSAIASLFLCVWRSFTFDLATKDDIIQDRSSHMIRANLSYHTFWNVVIMGRWRICGSPSNRVYFKVNRFKDNNLDPFSLIKRLFTLYSLALVWGYPIFLVITLLRMAFCKKPLC